MHNFTGRKLLSVQRDVIFTFELRPREKQLEDYIAQAYQSTADRVAAGDLEDGAESEDQE
jgi:hypothetical protein